MSLRKNRYKRELINKKMTLTILYGLVFLVSTLAYYFVSTSEAQNVLKIAVAVRDKDSQVADSNFEIKIAEEGKKYKAKISEFQGEFIVDKYIITTEEEFSKYKEVKPDPTPTPSPTPSPTTSPSPEAKKDEKGNTIQNTVTNQVNETIKENKTTSNTVETVNTIQNVVTKTVSEAKKMTVDGNKIANTVNETTTKSNAIVNNTINNVVSNNTTKSNTVNNNTVSNSTVKNNVVTNNTVSNNVVNNNTTKNTVTNELSNNTVNNTTTNNTANEDTQNEKELPIEVLPNEEFFLTEEQIKDKKIYVIAVYKTKEVKKVKLYDKIVSQKCDNDNIIVTGYMPKGAKVKATKVETNTVESKIQAKTKQEVKLKVAYDIKLVIDNKEFEPDYYDSEVSVQIINNEHENKSVNIWHVKADNNIEKIETEKINNVVSFNTTSFSIYGVEVLDDEDADVEDDNNTIQNSVSNEVSTNNTVNNTVNNAVNNEISNNITKEPAIKAANDGGLSKAPALRSVRVDPIQDDITLTINDYLSDYYYYKGKNYTDNISGTNQNTYTDSNLVRVTVVYHGFSQGQTNGSMKGRVSLTEREDIIENIRCLPIQNGTVTIDLMDNPFMDKPTGYGFGGWTSPNGTVTTDSHSKAQTLTVNASGEITVNVYASWIAAVVVYVNPTDGNDNLYDGLSDATPFGSWGKACQYINQHSTNKNDRERNIIVLTGNIDHSINSTVEVTGTARNYGTVTYNSSTSFTSGGTYILATNTGAGANAISVNSSGAVANEVLSDTYEPSDNSKWVITQSGNSYTIRNVGTNRFLAYSSRNGLYMSGSSYSWRYNNRRFYGSNRYIRYNNGWTYTNQQNSGQQFYFLTYTMVTQGTEVINTASNTVSQNSNYQSNRLALTVTSLYNHTDYRDDAVITLTTSTNFEMYNDFQIDFVNINASGYTADTDGTSAGGPYLYGNSYNVRIGRGMYPKTNTADNAATFRTVYGGSTSTSTGTSNSDNNAYKIVVESGKYSQIEGFHGTGSNNYYGTIYYTLGNDYDRAKGTNDQLKNYNRTTINRSSGVNGRRNVDTPAFIIDVKSGTFGHDYISGHSSSEDTAYAGIYVGGHGTQASSTARDISDRYCIVEGGNVANLIGGLKVTSGSGVETRIYVKGGTVKNIVGGAGVSTTYEDRIIQVTGGTVTYSVSGGSNGVYAYESGQDGKLSNGDTLVYIGGTAQIGSTSATETSLYGVDVGCVLGAGNGNDDVDNSGQVSTSHIIINDSAHILNSVYGGGNYGIVGDPNGTSATAKVEILGGTIDGNVYGGANRNNIYGSTTINVKAGQVKGAVYGGSNTSRKSLYNKYNKCNWWNTWTEY